MSTIGYGNVSPATVGGKIATMMVAVAGIPLCAFFLYKTAEYLSTAILWWSHLFHKWWYKSKESANRRRGMRRKSTAEDIVANVSDVRMLMIVVGLAVVFLLMAALGVHFSMNESWG